MILVTFTCYSLKSYFIPLHHKQLLVVKSQVENLNLNTVEFPSLKLFRSTAARVKFLEYYAGFQTQNQYLNFNSKIVRL